MKITGATAIGDGLEELKFNDGRRIYYTIIPANNVILLLGRGKNGQDSNIRKAKNSMKRQKRKPKKEAVLHLEDFEGIGKEHIFLFEMEGIFNLFFSNRDNMHRLYLQARKAS